MKQIYSVKGMHCGSCVGKVEKALTQVPHVEHVSVSLAKEEVEIDTTASLELSVLTQAVASVGKYTIAPAMKKNVLFFNVKKLKTFLPLILIFSTVIGWTMIREYLYRGGGVSMMYDFMGGFFLVFGGLKIINWKAFAISFRAYDPFAKNSSFYAYLYPLIEIMLGISYQFRLPDLLLPNITTIVVLSATTYGVLQNFKSQKSVQCACLGGFFSIPLSWFTVFENVLMIAMAFVMLCMAK